MSTLPSIASSGLQAAQLRLGTSAHNAANIQTPQFQRQSVAQQAQPGGGVTASVQTARHPGANLEADATQQMSATYAMKSPTAKRPWAL